MQALSLRDMWPFIWVTRKATIAFAAALTLAGCASWSGTSAGLFPSPFVQVDKPAYSASVTVLPDFSDPNVIAVQTRYTSKQGDLPDMAFAVEKPSPDTVIGTAKIRLNAGTPVPLAAALEK